MISLAVASEQTLHSSLAPRSSGLSEMSDDLWTAFDSSESNSKDTEVSSLTDTNKIRHRPRIRHNRTPKRHSRMPSLKANNATSLNYTWPIKRVAQVPGDIILGGLMMVHERDDRLVCGKIMPQGGIQALECMLFTIDYINRRDILPVQIGAYVLDDCDKDTYGLEQAVDFIKGRENHF